MTIPNEYLDMLWDCPECDGFNNTPDIVLGHLIEQHFYTVAEAESAFTWYMDEHPVNKAGLPLSNCDLHGSFYGHECYGCRSFDVEVA